MFYAKLDANSALERYPYTLTDLRRDNLQTSFGRKITNETAQAFNCVPVAQIVPPAENHTKNFERSAHLVDGTWKEQWIETDATAEQITERTTAKANDVRTQRDRLIAETDWVVVMAKETATNIPTAMKTYRQALRDLPSAAGFPHTMTWPTKPS